MNSRLLTLLSALCLMLMSCSGHDGPDAPVTAERTVLVYMVATNSLGTPISSGGITYEAADEADVAEMIRAANAVSDGRRLLVFRDRHEGAPALYELQKDGKMAVVKTYDRSASSLDKRRMRQIISDARSHAPAPDLGLVLWSHANGWLQDGKAESDGASKSLKSFGIDRSRRMNVTDLADALRGLDLEYIYFDCCLMGSVEVIYELRGCVPYIAASTSELPRPGMPYDLTLGALLSGAPEGIVRAARATFDYYRDHEDQLFRTCTMSVFSTDGMDRLAEVTRMIYDGAPLLHPGNPVTNYNATASSGYWMDFGEYAEALAELPGRDATLAERFRHTLDAVVIYKDATPRLWDRYPVYHNSGMSTYVFNEAAGFDKQNYNTLSWARDVVSAHIK